jgi:group I intron endonuclease
MSFIYLSENKINKKFYIGQTNFSLKQRKKKHEKIAKYSNTHFHRALCKYGFENFEWKILDKAKTQKELDNLEIKYIFEFNSIKNGYNMTQGGLGGVPNDEVKEKISQANKGRPSKYKGIPRSNETKQKISVSSKGRKNLSWTKNRKTKFKNIMIGHIVSDVTRRKIGLKNKGRCLGALTQEHKNKISKKLKGVKKPLRTIEHSKRISDSKKGKPWTSARRQAQNIISLKEGK